MPINLISDALLWKGRAENINEIVLQRYVQPILGLGNSRVIHSGGSTVSILHSVSFIQQLLLFSLLRVCFIHIIYLYSLSIVVGESSY